ncbi:methionine aminopeptidase [Clostridium algifaecis]|uniref:Methionine aminopeptidase n=1 Tax=Clostridium algifaecis TaxID=1472040 RepID=A0ABS4KSV0_9CLOT|nr:hypothetical protein [Clostridium algifaecis]MBP2033102.1 methionine aminopeptidase [Clostridium algifaecis]
MMLKIHMKMDCISHIGILVGETLKKFKEAIRLGISTLELDRIADEYVKNSAVFYHL